MSGPIAVVGTGCVFPDAPDPGTFWANLRAGRRSITRATAEDLGADPASCYAPGPPTPNTTYCLHGGYVRQREFDLTGYRVPADRLAGFDRGALWALDAARQALAGTGAERDRCGLVLGCLSFPSRSSARAVGPIYHQALAAVLADVLDAPALRPPARDRIGALDGTGFGADPAESVGAALGLGGPRFCLDAACASSLYAIKLACDLLESGRADLMLAGGVSGSHPLLIHMAFATFQAYPDDELSSFPLDSGSQGLLAGEGAGMVALKRLADAERDGDEIHAVIRGIGLSNDGAGRHPLAPHPDTQGAALTRAYAAAGVDPGSVQYVECHATGTPLGDLTELNTVERVFGGHAPLVGAVKSNLGHLLTAAGMAGTLKVIASMREGVIPATVGLRRPLRSDGGTLGPDQVVAVEREWPDGPGPRRGAVNAFGFGGTNAHMILEAPTAGLPVPPPAPQPAGIAVVGLAGLIGSERELPARRWRGLDESPELLRAHGFADGRPPTGRYLDGVRVDALRFKAPPGATDVPIAQQMVLLDVADRALRDAGVERGSRTAVLVAMVGEPGLHQYVARLELGRRVPELLDRAGLRLDPDDLRKLTDAARAGMHEELGVNRYMSYIGNIMATRVAGLWDLTGPAFTVTAAADDVRTVRLLADGMLRRGEADAVLVAAVDLAGGPEAVLAAGPDGPEPVDCAGAMVLVRADRAGRTYGVPDLATCRDLAEHAVAVHPEPPPAPRLATVVETGGGRLRDPLCTLGISLPPVEAPPGGHHGFLRARDDARAMLAALSGTSPGPDEVVWDRADLLEFAGGRVAPVFGPGFAAIDGHRRRVRLPMPPYLLVDRVTALDATPNEIRPSRITTEYDVPAGAWYTTEGQVPWSVAFESGQCDLLLISYLGVDHEMRGERVYRLLNCTLIFLDRLPREGATLRYEISIDSFARNGDTLLFFFSYDCFADGRKIMEMRDGCAGFFTDAELAAGRGIVGPRREPRADTTAVAPLLRTERTRLGVQDLDLLGAGDLAAVFGPAYDQGGRNPALRLAPARIRMVDRVTRLDPTGGAWGLGEIVGEKDLRPDDWYFPCHFRGDEVLAGSLMVEGCVQLIYVHLLSLGLQTRVEGATFEPVVGAAQRVRCRGQVTPEHRLLTYRVHVAEVGLDPEPYVRADVDVLLGDRVIVAFEGIGVRLAGTPVPLRALETPPAFDSRALAEFATGSMEACFGPDFACYATRRVPRIPNGDLHLMSRVVSVSGTRHDLSPGAELVAEFDMPERPWFDPDGVPPRTPYSVLMELALQPCGFLSGWLGSTLATPEEDFYFRNLDGDAELLAEPDLAGRTVRTRAWLLSSTALDGVVIQTFGFELGCGGMPLYRGITAFGYFRAAALAHQVGLDDGRRTGAWTAGAPFVPASSGPAMPVGQLDLLDELVVLPGGVRGRSTVDPGAWFFDAHFHQDPVMPGSLGVEALVQALKAHVVSAGVASRFTRPRFGQAAGHRTVWKYRGQIVRTDREMLVEVRVTDVRDEGDRVVVVGDGDLWKDGLRIYHVDGLALSVTEGTP